jgi:rhamnose transport system permease protein
MAMPMTLIIVAGEIDLSVESMAGLASAMLGFLWAAGVPLWIGDPGRPLVGALGGLLNGLLVARGGLPSLVVTLGTLALFRGMALIVLGPRASATSRRVHGVRLRSRARDADPVALRGLPRPGPGARHRPPPDVDRPPGLRHRQELRRGPLLGRPGDPGPVSLFVLSGLVASLAGDHPDVAPVSARADAGSGMTLTVVTSSCWAASTSSAARGRSRASSWRSSRGGHAERAASRQRDGRGPEHRPRAAPDPLGRHPHLCSPGQVGHRSSSRRPAPAGRLGRPW